MTWVSWVDESRTVTNQSTPSRTRAGAPIGPATLIAATDPLARNNKALRSPGSKFRPSANSIGTLAVLALALIGFVTGRPDFLDIAILYTLLNLIGTIAVLRYFHPSQN